MTDRNFVLRWAHLGLGRNPRQRQIIEEERRALEAHVADIQAEQEQKNNDVSRHFEDPWQAKAEGSLRLRCVARREA